MPPGATLTPLSLLVRLNAGELFTGVVSVAFVVVPPSALAEAVLLTCTVPAATGVTTLTANAALPSVAVGSAPMVSVQTVPAALLFGQLQPVLLPVVVNVVLGGTVSLSVTPVRPMLPVF